MSEAGLPRGSGTFQMPAPPGILRLLGALLYDSLLIIALLMIAALPWVMLTAQPGTEGLDFTHKGLGFQLYCLALIIAYYIVQWSIQGQTLGMKSWRLLLINVSGQRGIHPLRGLLRFVTAPLSWLPAGLGVLWQYTDSEGLMWHDRISATRVVITSKRRKNSYRTL